MASAAPRLRDLPAHTPEFSDLYPHRRADVRPSFTFWERFQGHGRTNALDRICQENVIQVVSQTPMVRHLLQALKNGDCSVDLHRHVACEPCQPGKDVAVHHGGYDEVTNQVFICSNNCTKLGDVQTALTRGLFTMYERCSHGLDFRSPDHLACLEVKKANLTGCTYLNYASQSFGTMALESQHPNCVRRTAEHGLVHTHFMSRDMASEAVERALRTSPRVKLLVEALEAAGCPFSASRHLASECCSAALAGGYDPLANQIVICANQCRDPAQVESTLAHELVHLYDHCANQLDLSQPDHLACTEVRAANLIHCQSPLDSGWPLGAERPACVRRRAANSVAIIRGVPLSQGLPMVDRVWDRCARDLEPIGRVTYTKTCETLAYSEFRHFRPHMSSRQDVLH
eukprot:maker-scaffold2453_size15579-snap-gene-0.4 protein:Tk07727 transcript:maker-scaffold2453_size15579-snap-gene-0.4-mRNA-1 annotation:"hypothetical protein AaeL_AAEL000332"